MIGLLCFGLAILISPFRSKSRLEAENAVLRHQLIVLRRKMRGRPQLTNNDRWFFIQLYRWFPAILQVLTIIRPDTLVRWHRAGFRRYWSWKSRPRGGRPQIETELRVLIRRMSVENPLWGAPRIHGDGKSALQEEAMSTSQYYVVGNNDVWMIQFKDTENGQYKSSNEAISFAIATAQKLGMRGERAHVCVLDGDGRLRCKWSYDREIVTCARVA